MRDRRLYLSSVNFISIVDCQIRKEVNSHGQAIISGYIEKADEDDLIFSNADNIFSRIEIHDEVGNIAVLFSGLVESIRIESVDDLKKATVILVGGTRLLEGEKHIRIFQNQTLSYDQLLNKINQAYQEARYVMAVGTGIPIGDMIVQYQESDWEFLKRLASHFNTVILPAYQEMAVKYSFGLPAGVFKEAADVLHYSLENNIDELEIKRNSGLKGIISQDAFAFRIKSREVYELGQGISFQGQSLYIYSLESHYVGGELVHSYELRLSGGFQVPKFYNEKIIGASLDGVILDVAGDQVKVQINADDTQDKSSAKWLPYSTVYSSPDGSGWYCMPEVNDQVRIYFPNEKEAQGYAISSIHQGGNITNQSSSKVPRSNPDNKSLLTKHKKQIELTPGSIIMTNNKGMSVVLDDEEGIHIISNKNILIESEEGVTIKSKMESIMVEAADSIQLIQGGTTVILKDDITVKGATFKME